MWSWTRSQQQRMPWKHHMWVLKLPSLAFISMKLNNFKLSVQHNTFRNNLQPLSLSQHFLYLLLSVSSAPYFLNNFSSNFNSLQLQNNFVMSLQCIFYYSDIVLYTMKTLSHCLYYRKIYHISFFNSPFLQLLVFQS